MNLQLTNQVDYAIRAMAYLAWREQDKWIPTNVIAEKMQIPPKFLSRINICLVRSNLICTKRGIKGGVMLAKPADDITVHDVFVAIEGPVLINKCIANPETCTYPLNAQLIGFWQSNQDFIENKLKSTSLADLVNLSSS